MPYDPKKKVKSQIWERVGAEVWGWLLDIAHKFGGSDYTIKTFLVEPEIPYGDHYLPVYRNHLHQTTIYMNLKQEKTRPTTLAVK